MKNQIIAWIGTIAAGAAGIGVFMKVYGKQIFRGLKIARTSLDLIDDILEAVKPDADGKVTITADEVAKFTVLANKLKEDLK